MNSVPLVRADNPGANRSHCPRRHSGGNGEMNEPQAVREVVKLYRAGRFGDVATRCRDILAADPDNFDALHLLGEIRHRQGRDREALILLAAALKQHAASPEVLSRYGRVLQALKKPDEAFAAYRKALEIAPAHAEAFYHRGQTMLWLNRCDEALECFDAAVALEPEHALAISGSGHALELLDRPREALERYRKALALTPDLAEARYRAGVAHLKLGEFEQGWSGYDWRWHRRGFTDLELIRRNRLWPRWNGERVNGTLLVWRAHGLGAEIFNSSMVPELAAYADRIVLEVEARLVNLLARSFPGVTVIPRSSELYAGPVAAHEGLWLLGKHLRKSRDDFPRRERGYLVPDEKRSTALRARLAGDGRAVIGLAWSSKAADVGQFKSAKLIDFASLFQLPGCRFVDLQYGDTRAERETVARELGATVQRLEDVDNTNDIDALAALVTACDVVVAISGTTAHLAGAIGKPTWVMASNGYGKHWYWGCGDGDSPWYCRVRVRHQKPAQSWTALISAIAPEIAEYLASSSWR
jgi:tetratricopeptide (TPR) repeat protein